MKPDFVFLQSFFHLGGRGGHQGAVCFIALGTQSLYWTFKLMLEIAL